MIRLKEKNFVGEALELAVRDQLAKKFISRLRDKVLERPNDPDLVVANTVVPYFDVDFYAYNDVFIDNIVITPKHDHHEHAQSAQVLNESGTPSPPKIVEKTSVEIDLKPTKTTSQQMKVNVVSDTGSITRALQASEDTEKMEVSLADTGGQLSLKRGRSYSMAADMPVSILDSDAQPVFPARKSPKMSETGEGKHHLHVDSDSALKTPPPDVQPLKKFESLGGFLVVPNLEEHGKPRSRSRKGSTSNNEHFQVSPYAGMTAEEKRQFSSRRLAAEAGAIKLGIPRMLVRTSSLDKKVDLVTKSPRPSKRTSPSQKSRFFNDSIKEERETEFIQHSPHPSPSSSPSKLNEQQKAAIKPGLNITTNSIGLIFRLSKTLTKRDLFPTVDRFNNTIPVFIDLYGLHYIKKSVLEYSNQSLSQLCNFLPSFLSVFL